MKKLLLLSILCISTLFADRSAPIGWGGFQMGLVNNGAVEWNAPMKAATEMGSQYKLDRRYIYIDDTLNFPSYWTAEKNWSRDSFYVAHDIKPAVVIYMLQRGGDSWSAVSAGMDSQAFMKSYFRHLTILADSTKGEKPLYILEPDVWTYMLQNAREHDPNRYTTTIDDWNKIQDNNFDQLCHINDLGFPWLEEFENKVSNLPGAIIKTLKMRDPEAFVGLLVGFWGFAPSTATTIGLFADNSDVIAIGARETAKFIQALLNSTPYKGDFAGLEKNGGDLGFWMQTNQQAYVTAFDWDNRKNADWIKFARTISDSVDLPMIGWQIAIGHLGLANIENEYEDNFFPYFFTHTQDYIDAGFIGMMASTANQGKGTMPTPPDGQLYIHPLNHPSGTRGDDGWFYTQYATFNTGRPWLPDQGSFHTIIAEVVPDTVVLSTVSKYPAWRSDSAYSYNTPRSDTLNYDGKDWTNSGYWIGTNVIPGTDPSKWKLVGPSGTFEVTVGGTVDNSVVYYTAGTEAIKNFNPVAIADYGIDTIWVNGVPVSNMSSYSTPSLSEDIIIKVRFIKGRDPVPVSSPTISTQARYSAVTIRSNQLYAHLDAEVALFTISGKRVLQRSLRAGNILWLEGMRHGIYIAQITSTLGIQTLRVKQGF